MPIPGSKHQGWRDGQSGWLGGTFLGGENSSKIAAISNQKARPEALSGGGAERLAACSSRAPRAKNIGSVGGYLRLFVGRRSAKRTNQLR
jgi:hypothetical protein